MKILLFTMALMLSHTAFGQTTCTPYNTIMYAAPYATGNATISNDATNIYVDLAADAVNGWTFNNVLMYAGSGPIPAASDGELLPGFFPFVSNQTAVTTFHYAIPLTSTGMTCGQTLQMAVYTVSTNASVNWLTWVYGPNSFANNSFSFEYTPCCPNVGNTGCTNTQGYYKTHNVYAKKSQKIPWLLSENTLLCGKRWYDVLNTTPKSGDAWTNLAQQWIAAKLNVASGASTGSIVDTAIYDSEYILNSFCSNIPKSATAERQMALEYNLLLTNYNSGLTGPGMCK